MIPPVRVTAPHVSLPVSGFQRIAIHDLEPDTDLFPLAAAVSPSMDGDTPLLNWSDVVVGTVSP